MSDLDLNIGNYSIDDLEKFFRLQAPYSESDVSQKEFEIRKLLLSSGHIAPHFKRDLIIFLEEGKKLIVENKITKLPPTTIYKTPPSIPDTFPLQNVSLSSRADNVLVQNEDYTINPNEVKRIVRTLNVDTLFRENYEITESTDFLLSLNEPIKNVMSLKLASLELPNMWYTFSSAEKTNEFKINCFNIPDIDDDGNDISYNENYTIQIPDGNYSASSFENILNNIFINTGNGLRHIRFEINEFSTKSIFRAANSTDTGNIDPYANGRTDFFFTLDFEVSNLPVSKTAGWMLGFRKLIYDANFDTQHVDLTIANSNIVRNYIQSDSSFGSNDNPYVFLELDDFQRNCVTDKIISNNKHYLGNNILARITLTTGKNTIVMDNGSDNMFKRRDYFGPTKLEKFRIRLLDRYGSVINLNRNDFSFILEIEQKYCF